MSAYTTLRLEHPRPGIALATLQRPERLNAITFEKFDEFVALQREIDADPEVRVLILTGGGRGFCAGLDLDLAAQLSDMPAAVMLDAQEHWADSVTGFARMDTLVIAAVN